MRDSLLSQLRELNKSKPRNNADEALLAEVTRLESSLSLAKEDLVGVYILFQLQLRNLMTVTRLLLLPV